MTYHIRVSLHGNEEWKSAWTRDDYIEGSAQRDNAGWYHIDRADDVRSYQQEKVRNTPHDRSVAYRCEYGPIIDHAT